MTIETSPGDSRQRDILDPLKRTLYNPTADSLGMKIATIGNDVAYRAWRLLNPGKSFADFYAWQVTRKLNRGRAHKSLGQRRFDQDSLIGTPPKHDAESFSAYGRPEFAELIRQVLRHNQKVVDYGCGSLRIGQHCIDLLEPENYVGMDITDRFFRDGVNILDPSLLTAKKPRFSMIGEDSLDRVAAWKPDFIYAVAVTQHVPLAELDSYFARLCRMKSPGTRLAIFFIAAERQLRLKGKSWAYEATQLTDRLQPHCPDARLQVIRCAYDRRPTKIETWEAVIIAD